MTVPHKGGRVATGRIRRAIMFTLSPDTMQALDVLSEYMGKPRSQVLDDAVLLLAEVITKGDTVRTMGPGVAARELSRRLLDRSEPHVVTEGGTQEDADYWAARDARLQGGGK